MKEQQEQEVFNVGDYVRWPIGVSVFSASSDGEVKPLEIQYLYGIVVDIARGYEEYSDVVIIYHGPNKQHNWIVCHVDDDRYKLEIVSGIDNGG